MSVNQGYVIKRNVIKFIGATALVAAGWLNQSTYAHTLAHTLYDVIHPCDRSDMKALPSPPMMDEHDHCLSDTELSALRGGYVNDEGIVIGFGFERIVRVDGEVQEHVLANLPVLNLGENIKLVPFNRVVDAESNKESAAHVAQSILATLPTTPSTPATPATPATPSIPSIPSLPGGNMAFDNEIIPTSPNVIEVTSSHQLTDLLTNVIQNSIDETSIEQIRAINIELMGLGSVPSYDPEQTFNPTLFESLLK